jgi:hypothetical protein
MSLLPDGEELRRAMRLVSEHLQDDPDQPLGPLVQQAIFTCNLSPRDSEALIEFYRQAKERQSRTTG